jgi:hypothetical protein
MGYTIRLHTRCGCTRDLQVPGPEEPTRYRVAYPNPYWQSFKCEELPDLFLVPVVYYREFSLYNVERVGHGSVLYHLLEVPDARTDE